MGATNSSLTIRLCGRPDQPRFQHAQLQRSEGRVVKKTRRTAESRDPGQPLISWRTWSSGGMCTTVNRFNRIWHFTMLVALYRTHHRPSCLARTSPVTTPLPQQQAKGTPQRRTNTTLQELHPSGRAAMHQEELNELAGSARDGWRKR